MKVILLNGSPNAEGCTYTALTEAAGALHKNGIETELIHIGKKPVQGCIACFACGKAGKCVFNDQVNELADKIAAADAVIIGSPVYYANPNGSLMALLDRLMLSAGWRFNGKLGAAVVSARRGGCTAAFDSINRFFSMCNIHIVSSQYWNQVHGFAPEDVNKDLEGLQTMRTLGENMAWLLKCIALGKGHDITAPTHEETILTNFIR